MNSHLFLNEGIDCKGNSIETTDKQMFFSLTFQLGSPRNIPAGVAFVQDSLIAWVRLGTIAIEEEEERRFAKRNVSNGRLRF